MLMNRDAWPLSEPELRRQLSDVCTFMAAACLLITPVLGAIPMARERRERSCDFLSTVPVARGVHIASKLAVCIILIVAAPIVCVRLAILVAPYGSIDPPVVFDRELVAGFSLAFLALGGVAWLFGSFMRSEAIAAGCTFLVVISAAIALALVADRYRIDSKIAYQWYVLIMLVTGIGGLLGGTTIALARRTW
ncbi:MAG: hypothetical protein NTV94_00095 [Planctomycetota bacterium]|nr:hypothetical protein [Planctomycetota bacterium]